MNNSAKDVTADVLSDENRTFLEESGAPMINVVMMVRRNWPRMRDASMYYHRRLFGINPRDNRYDNKIASLGDELYKYLLKNGYLRAFNTSRFNATALIWALRKKIAENKVSSLLDIKYAIIPLRNSLDCEHYETWNGYGDKQYKAILNYLKDHLSDAEYNIMSLRYGLDEKGFRSRKAIVAELNLGKTESYVRNVEDRAIGKLHADMETFLALTEIK